MPPPRPQPTVARSSGNDSENLHTTLQLNDVVVAFAGLSEHEHMSRPCSDSIGVGSLARCVVFGDMAAAEAAYIGGGCAIPW
mmetsp:Transcript_5305/g.13097  ORF Transcript_5305/g.13097 Transcript_5305/m.13097 type:complete len:82 (+) Transcript_5305:113-358(+)